jgi:hypothetical protein
VRRRRKPRNSGSSLVEVVALARQHLIQRRLFEVVHVVARHTRERGIQSLVKISTHMAIVPRRTLGGEYGTDQAQPVSHPV